MNLAAPIALQGLQGGMAARPLVRSLERVDHDGVLLGVYRHLGNHIKLGAGYNFSKFSDDLTDLDVGRAPEGRESGVSRTSRVSNNPDNPRIRVNFLIRNLLTIQLSSVGTKSGDDCPREGCPQIAVKLLAYTKL